MVTWPGLPADVARGDTVTHTLLNEVYDLLDALIDRPRFYIEDTSITQSIATATTTTLDMQSLTTSSAVSTTINTASDLIQIQAGGDGIWCFWCQAYLAVGTTGTRLVRVQLPSYVTKSDADAGMSGTGTQTGGSLAQIKQAYTGPVELAEGDQVRFQVRHTEGSNINVTRWAAGGYWLGTRAP